MSQETTAAKTPGQIACEVCEAPVSPDESHEDRWEAVAEAVAAPLRARIAELEAERDRLADALNDNPDPLVSSLQSQVEYFCDLVAEILAALEVACEEGALPGDGALAAWRQRAGLET